VVGIYREIFETKMGSFGLIMRFLEVFNMILVYCSFIVTVMQEIRLYEADQIYLK
jgi:hypothetical protein